jgi:DNA-binding transcriptional regulator YiaG
MINQEDEKKIFDGYAESARKINGSNRNGSARLKLRATRAFLGMTQQQFADHFGISLDTVKSWESNSRKEPNGIARLVIELISNDPHSASKLAKMILATHSADTSRDEMEVL